MTPTIIPRNLVMCLCVCFVTSNLLAQRSHVSLRAGESVYSNYDPSGQIRQFVSVLDTGKLHPLEVGSDEHTALMAAENAARSVVILPPLGGETSLGYVASLAGVGELLVSKRPGIGLHWPEQEVWIVDGPQSTTILIEVTPEIIGQPDVSAGYWDGLVQWREPPGEPDSLELIRERNDRGARWVSGVFQHVPTARGGTWLRLTAAVVAGRGYVLIALEKRSLSHYYPDGSIGVPERFPPLRQRLSVLEKEKLLGELGRGYTGRLESYPNNRDRAIVVTLLSRGRLSYEEVRRVVAGELSSTNSDIEVVSFRLGAFLSAATEKQVLSNYTTILERLLPELVSTRIAEDFLVPRVFAMMASDRIDFSQAALSFLRQGRFVRQSLSYLKRESADEATLNALEQQKVSVDMEADKMLATQQIKERLAVKRGQVRP